MRKHLWIMWAFVFFMGCATSAEKRAEVQVPEPAYQPQRIYPLPFNQAWAGTLEALKEDQVPIQIANKEEGLIRTDYQPAPKGMRYKFNIKLSKAPEEKTAIQIRCTYEGKDEKGEYKDYTYASPRQVVAMEDGLYRRIESVFLVKARGKETQETPVAVSAAPPAPTPPPSEPPPKVEAPPPVTAPPPPAEEAKKPAYPPQLAYTILVTQKTGLLMSEPSSESAVLMVLKKGLELEKIGETGSWMNVQLESGKKGWVPMDIFDMPGASMVASKKPDKPAPKKEETQPPPAALKESPSPKPASVPPPKGEVEKASKTLAAKANVHMREAPSAQSRIVTTLAKGKQVEKLGEQAEFTRVRIPGGKTGWVASRYLEEVAVPAPRAKADLSKTQPTKVEKIALITKDKAPLKGKPAEDSKTITVLKKGREVERIGKSGSWTKVKLSWGTEGWVADSLLEKRP